MKMLKKIFHRRVVFILIVVFIFCSKVFCNEIKNPAAKNSPKKAEGLLLNSFSRTAFSLGASFNIPLGDFRNFSFLTGGIDFAIEYEFLPQFIPYVTTGALFKAEALNFFTHRPEINSFNEGSFVQGIWFRFYLPKDFIVQSNLFLGLAFIHLDAQSVDNKSIDDIYYDFLLGTSLSVRKEFAKNSICNFLWNVEVPFTCQFEKSNSMKMVGINLSVIADFKPLAKRNTKYEK